MMGRGLVKELSGRLARKLQRSASLVNAGLSAAIQTVLDAATADRCDFVEVSGSDAPCLTESKETTTMRRHARSGLFVSLKKTSECVVRARCDCLSEQLHTLQSLSQADVSAVFLVCGSGFANWWHMFGNGLQNMLAELSSCENSELSR